MAVVELLVKANLLWFPSVLRPIGHVLYAEPMPRRSRETQSDQRREPDTPLSVKHIQHCLLLINWCTCVYAHAHAHTHLYVTCLWGTLSSFAFVSFLIKILHHTFDVVFIRWLPLLFPVHAHRSSHFQWAPPSCSCACVCECVCVPVCVYTYMHHNCASIFLVSPVMQGCGTWLCFFSMCVYVGVRDFSVSWSMFLLCNRQVFFALMSDFTSRLCTVCMHTVCMYVTDPIIFF